VEGPPQNRQGTQEIWEDEQGMELAPLWSKPQVMEAGLHGL